MPDASYSKGGGGQLNEEFEFCRCGVFSIKSATKCMWVSSCSTVYLKHFVNHLKSEVIRGIDSSFPSEFPPSPPRAVFFEFVTTTSCMDIILSIKETSYEHLIAL